MSDLYEQIINCKKAGCYGKALNLLAAIPILDKSMAPATSIFREMFLKRFLFGQMLCIQFKIDGNEAFFAYAAERMLKLDNDIYIRIINRSLFYYDVLAMLPFAGNEEALAQLLFKVFRLLHNYRITRISTLPVSPDDSFLLELASNLIRNNACANRDMLLSLTDEPKEFLESHIYSGSLKTENRPELSVIIPVYNNAPFLEECLDSVVNHPLKNLEIIVVDDGSTDNSRDIIKKYLEKDQRIQLHCQKNSGAAFARNRGIELSRGHYLAFLDSDDFWFQNDTLEKMLAFASENSLNICGGNMMSYENGRLLPSSDKKMSFEKDGIFNYKTLQHDYGYWRFIYNTDFIKTNRLSFPNYRRFQDPPFFVAAMLAAGNFGAIAEDFYAWRVAYKKMQMNYVQVCDFIKGLTDNLIFSRNSNLPRLHNLCIARINFKTYTNAIKRYKKDKYVTTLLNTLNSAIDLDLLRNNGYEMEDDYKIKLLRD